MNVSDFEDAFFSCVEWILGHADNTDDPSIVSPKAVYASESEEDTIIR